MWKIVSTPSRNNLRQTSWSHRVPDVQHRLQVNTPVFFLPDQSLFVYQRFGKPDLFGPLFKLSRGYIIHGIAPPLSSWSVILIVARLAARHTIFPENFSIENASVEPIGRTLLSAFWKGFELNFKKERTSNTRPFLSGSPDRNFTYDDI